MAEYRDFEVLDDDPREEDGSLVVNLDDAGPVRADATQHDVNLALALPELELPQVAQEVFIAVEDDIASRAEWEELLVEGLKELGLRIEDTTDPFEGACTAVHPLLIENAVKFQSKAIHEVFPAQGPVKIREDALPPGGEAMKVANAARVFLNYQLTEEMDEYYEDTERLLFHVGVMGSAFRKSYWDTFLRRPVSEFVPVDHFIVGYNTSDLKRARRYTHILCRTEDEYKSDIEAEIYADLDLGPPGQATVGKIAQEIDRLRGITVPTNYNAYTFYEHHCYLKLSVDGYELLPYIVTLDKQTQKILAIRRNWDQADALKKKVEYFTHYTFVPGIGFYGLGLIHLIGSLGKTASSTLRILVDSAMFATLQGGFKARGLRIVGGNKPIEPGEFRDVEAVGLDLTKAIVPLPFKEPSATAYELLKFVVMSGQKFADSTEQVIADSNNQGPVGTTMALLEASTRFFSAIHKRMHNSFKRELAKIVRLNAMYHPREDIKKLFSQTDVQIIPTSDPNTPSNAHRLARLQTMLQMSTQAPEIYNKAELHKDMLIAMGQNDPERYIPPPPQPQPLDPLSDILAATQGQPIKAFEGQDHDSHVIVKQAFLQNPAGGQNQAMGQVAPMLAANIREHLVLRFVERVKAMGGTDEQAMAKAASQVAQMDIAQAQALTQEATGPDPYVAIERDKVRLEEKKHEDTLITKVAELALRKYAEDIKAEKLEKDDFAKGAQVGQKDKADTLKVAVKAKTDMEKIAAQERGQVRQAQIQREADVRKSQLDEKKAAMDADIKREGNELKAAKDMAEVKIKDAAQQAKARDKETPEN